MSTFVAVNITCNVWDAQALWDKACDQAASESGDDRTPPDYLGPRDNPDLGACLAMLLDRSEHLEGADIVETSTDWEGVEDAPEPALLGYQFGRGGWSIAGDDDDPTGGASWEIIPPEHAEAWREAATAGGSDAELMPIHDNGCIEEPTFIGPPGAQ